MWGVGPATGIKNALFGPELAPFGLNGRIKTITLLF
jgi:hypothetical protein